VNARSSGTTPHTALVLHLATQAGLLLRATEMEIIIIIKGIYIAQVRKGRKCAMSAEMTVWLRNCLCLSSYLHN